MSRHHSGYAGHKWMKRGRMGQIAAIGAVGYYGFTTIEGMNIKGVGNDIYSRYKTYGNCLCE